MILNVSSDPFFPWVSAFGKGSSTQQTLNENPQYEGSIFK